MKHSLIPNSHYLLVNCTITYIVIKLEMQKEEKLFFTETIHNIVKLIPRGRVTSYGAIAKAAGFPNLSRMVGRILSHSIEMKIPAHRVVNSQGILSGKSAFGTNNEMQKILESEGIIVINDKVQNLKKIFWNPIDEISLK